MKRFITTALLSLTLSRLAAGAPDPIYQNPDIVNQAPTIDAVIFENSGIFNVSTLLSLSNTISTAVGFSSSSIPFATRDTKYFTNSGSMIGTPGFRFDTATATTRFAASVFNNRGTVIAQDQEAFPEFFSTTAGTTAVPQYSQPVPSQLLINASNVINSGELAVGNVGLLRIVASGFTNAFGALAAGGVNTGGSSAEIISGGGVETLTDPLDSTGRGSVDSGLGYFVNPPYVYDVVWGATNVTTPGPGVGLQVDALAGSLPSVPPMDLGFRGLFGLVGLGASEVGGPLSQYASYLFTKTANPTNIYFEIVLVNTNFVDNNIGASVRFSPDWFNPIPPANAGDPTLPVPVVQYAITTTDVLTGDLVTNAVYLIDSGAQMTNAVLYDNSSTANNYDRPFNFEVTTATPFEWDIGTSVDQTPFDPTLVYAPGSFEANNVGFFASEYGVQIGRDPETLDGTFASSLANLNGNNILAIEDDLLLGEGVALYDPTNEAGRIEITAGQADLTAARIRAEGIVVLNITNLIGAGTGASDWGMTDASIGRTNGNLVLANFFPTNFQRLRGSLFAWSATWENVFTNDVTTNEFHMHVLVVDQALRGNFHSTIRNLTLNGASTINVQNDLNVISQAQFNTSNLMVNANVTLTQGAGNFSSANAPQLKSLFVNTNGSIAVDSLFDVGYSLSQGSIAPNKRKYSVLSIVNEGTISATAPLFQSEFFTNDGIIDAENNGSIAINANQLTLGSLGAGSPSFLVAEGSIALSAESIQASNTIISTGFGQSGSLVLGATQNLSDGVSGAPRTTPNIVNSWQVSDGFSLPVKPATGDLFGTEILTIAPPRSLVTHVWAGVDMGPNPAGFANNVVIGRLILDRVTNSSVMRFTGAGTQNALYVDDLILTNASHSDYRNGLIIDPNIKIYFANANADPFKLMEVYPNGLIWVSNFFGPNSTVSVPYLNSANSCLMNSALATSPEIGFFGVPNAFNQPYVLNDPSDPSIVAPCPSEASVMRLFVVANPNTAPGTAYQSLIVAANGSGTIGPTPKQQQLALGSSDTLIATPAKGWIFSDWKVSGVPANSDTTSPVLKFTIGANSIVTANFIPNPFAGLRGVYSGLFYDENNATANNSGFFTMTLSPSGSFSGRLMMGASTYNFSSLFYGLGVQKFPATSGKKSLIVNLQVDTTGSTSQLHGDISGGTWDSPLTANLAPIWTAKNPSPFSGKFSIALSGGAGIGDSSGTVTVSKLGMVTVGGNLADGSRFSQTAPVSAIGEWPFYTYVAAGKDEAFGWVNFAAGGLSSTNLVWIKAPGAGRNYPAGVDAVMQMIGAPCVPLTGRSN